MADDDNEPIWPAQYILPLFFSAPNLLLESAFLGACLLDLRASMEEARATCVDEARATRLYEAGNN